MNNTINDTPALLELSAVSKIYRSGENELRALDQVSLTIRAGEFVAIIGQSGSGKSTLMNILGCLDRPGSGDYRVAGQRVAELDADELAALRRDTFGFVFQRYNLLATASAAENIEIPAVYAGHGQHARAERAQTLLARLGLADRGGHRPNQLSGGQQQRVSIARALMNNPAVILADEPTGALDSQSGADVLNLLDELHAEGRTILLITHDAEVAARAERIIRISDGRIIEDTPSNSPPCQGGDFHSLPLGKGEGRGGGIADWRGGIAGRRGGYEAPYAGYFLEAVKMALRSLRANLFRTALTLLGVVIGVAAVVTMLAIGNGSQQDVLARIQSMGTNLLTIRPGAPGVRPSGENASLVPADAEALSTLPNVETVVPQRSTRTTLRASNIDYQTSVQGVWPGFPAARDWPLAAGSFFTDADVKGYAPVIVLGQTVAGNLFADGRDPLGQYVLVKNVPFEVIGVLAGKGASAFGSDMDDIALVPLSTGFMRLFGRQYLNDITVRVSDVSAIDATQDAITELLTTRHRAEDFQVRNTASLLETVQATQNTLTVLLGSVAAISLLVGGIGVMNIMLVSVTERTREIGIRMATGARMRDILLQFNTEALVVCGIGGLIGVLLGLGAALLVQSLGTNVAFSAGPPLLAFSCAFITGLLFGYLPARKAARLDPVVALASE